MKQKDSFNYTRRSRWLFLSLLALLLTLGGTTSAWADAKALPYSYGFEGDGSLSGDWTLNNIANNNQSYVKVSTSSAKTGTYGYQLSSYNGGTANQLLISPEITAPNGVIISFAYKSSNSGSYSTETFKVGYSTTDTEQSSFTWDEAINENSATWKTYENTFPSGTKYIAVNYTSANKYYLYVDDFYFEGVATGPALNVLDGATKLTSGYSYNFGLATSSDTKTFTLKNPGTESITLNIAATNGFSVSPTNVTIAAKGEQTLTVTMADATADGTVTITPVEAVDPFTINVSGTLRDPNKVYLDFSDGQMPEGWTDVAIGSYASSYGTAWTVSTGYISQSNNNNSYERAFVSPLLSFEKDETILFETAKYASSAYYSPSIKIQYSTDGSSWETIGSAYTDDVYGTWTKRSVTIPVEGVKYIRFSGWYVQLRNIYGGQLPDGANFAINTTDNASQNLGVAAIGGALEKTFTITNSGNAALTVTFAPTEGVTVPNYVVFSDALNWGTAYVHYWGGSASTTWPGVAMTEIGTNTYGQKQFKAVIPADATGIIFNNGNGAQTVDITHTNGTGGYYTIDEQENGKYKAGSWNNGPNWNVDAKGTRDFTVALSTATAGAKSGNVVLTFNAINGGSPFTIPVTGVVLPEDATVVDFNDNQLPAGWGNNASNKWSFSDGKAYCTSAAELTTSQLQFSDGDFFVIKATSYDDYDNNYLKIYTSTDGSTWESTPIKTFISRSQIPYGSYASLVVTDIPTSVKYLKFTGYYVRIDDIIGLKFNDNAPVLGYYTDEDCTAAAAATETKNFGFVTEAPSAQVYYIKNDGTGTMTLSLGDVPTGFTAALGTTSLGKDAKTTLTIGMDAESKGYHNGDIVVTAKNSSDEPIGTFTVTATGVMMDAGKSYVNFATEDAKVPAGWTANSWTVTQGANGYIYSGTSSNELITTSLTAAEGGETLVFTASGDKTNFYNPAELKVYTKTGDADWSEATDLTSNLTSTSTWFTLAVNVPEGNNLIKFEGKNVYIQRIYGLTAVPVAVMTTTAENIAFGMQAAESAEQTFTITNDGDANLTGLSVALGKTGAAAEYSVRMEKDDAEFTGTTIAPSEVVTVYVKQLFDLEKLGDKSDALTIAADGQESVAINLTGATRDPSKLYADFNDGTWPEGWQTGANWSIYTYNNNGWARQTSESDASSLITTPVTVGNGQKLTFKAAKNGTKSIKDLTVKYTIDGGLTWNTYDWANYDGIWEEGQTVKDRLTSDAQSFEIVNIPEGTAAFEFNGKYVQIHEVVGEYANTTAPLMTLTTVSDGISDANLKADGTATYTLANNGNAEYVGTVDLTNVTAAVAGDVTYEAGTLTIPAGKTATITVTMAFAEPYGVKNGTMVITSESWVGDINKAYTATLVDPTAFVEDFAGDTKPAGWYSENWTYNTGVATINAGVEKPMITEKIGAVEGKNTLSFDAKINVGSEDQTLKVYTSTDPKRKVWSEAQSFTLNADFQTFALEPLADGNYYVKFEAVNAMIDNIKGVKKLETPEHDLYEVSATLPTEEVTPGKAISATVNVASLITAETVAAELYFGESKVGELTDQEEITTSATKQITINGTAPAAGTYDVYVKIYNGDVAIETDKVNVTVADTHKLNITNFTALNSSVDADEDNHYEATFLVTIQNTGTASLTAGAEGEVRVIVTDPSDNVFDAKWTAATSNVLYMNTKKDGDIADDCTLKAWCWNTAEDGVWATFTNINDGFWSVDLQGKTNFIICRVNPDGTDENPWNNVWNRSGDLSLASGNLVKFNGYSDGDLTFTHDNMAYLEPTMTTTLKVTVSGTVNEDASIAYSAKEDVSSTAFMLSKSVNVSSVIILDEEVGTVANSGDNHRVKLTRKLVNGWNTICLPFALESQEAIEELLGEGTKAYQFNGLTEDKLNFSVTSSMTAGTPYLVHTTAAKDIDKQLISDVTVVASAYASNVYFKGTFAPKVAGELTGMYGVSNSGSIAKANDKTTMKGFRAYFDLPSGVNARLAIFDETTGITRIFGADEIFGKDDKVYDLNGRRVENAKKGVYIVNGRKMVVK